MRGFGHGALYYNNTTTTINNRKGNPINGDTGFAPSAMFFNDVNPAVGNYIWVNTGNNGLNGNPAATWTNLI